MWSENNSKENWAIEWFCDLEIKKHFEMGWIAIYVKHLNFKIMKKIMMLLMVSVFFPDKG